LRIVFMGTPEFAIPSLEMLVREGYEVAAVVTQPDKPKGRGKKTAMPPVKEFAIKNNIEVLQPSKVKTPEFVSTIRELRPDLLVTAAYGKSFPRKSGHTSLWVRKCSWFASSQIQGAAPINWAIINGEKVTGITTMYTDAGMDTGDMLLKAEIEISDDMTAGELHDKLACLGAEVLRETLKKIEDSTLQRIPQPHEQATYAPMLDKTVGCINWSKSARDVHNLVRGTNPWPVALHIIKDKK